MTSLGTDETSILRFELQQANAKIRDLQKQVATGSIAGSTAGRSPVPSVVSGSAAASRRTAGGAGADVLEVKLQNEKLSEEVAKLKRELETTKRALADANDAVVASKAGLEALKIEVAEREIQLVNVAKRWYAEAKVKEHDMARLQAMIDSGSGSAGSAAATAFAAAAAAAPVASSAAAPKGRRGVAARTTPVASAAAPAPPQLPPGLDALAPLFQQMFHQFSAAIGDVRSEIATIAAQVGNAPAPATSASTKAAASTARAPPKKVTDDSKSEATTATAKRSRAVAAAESSGAASGAAAAAAAARGGGTAPAESDDKPRRGRPRKEDIEQRVAEARRAGLEGVVAANVDGVLAPVAATVAARSAGKTVDFGDTPIDHFIDLRLTVPMGDSKGARLLERQLVLFFNDDMAALARAVIAHFGDKGREMKAGAFALQVERLAEIDFFPALVGACQAHVARLMTPDALAVDHTAQLRCVAAAFHGFATAASDKVTTLNAPPPASATLAMMLDATAAYIRVERTLGDDAQGRHTALSQLLAVLLGCTDVERVPSSKRSAAASRVVASASSLLVLTIRAIVENAVAQQTAREAGVVGAGLQPALASLSAALGGAPRGLPFDRICSATLQMLSGPADSASACSPAAAADALFALRLQLLHRGYSYLETIQAAFAARAGTDSLDAHFVVILAFAIVDFGITEESEDWVRFSQFFSAFAASKTGDVSLVYAAAAIISGTSDVVSSGASGIGALETAVRWIMQQGSLGRAAGGTSKNAAALRQIVCVELARSALGKVLLSSVKSAFA